MTIASLIIDVGMNVLGMQNEVAKVNDKLDSMGGAVNKVGALVAQTFTVTAMLGFTEQLIETASNIHDVAEALGVSTEAVQRYKYAAEQSGATIDDVGRAINYMNKQLAGGDSSTTQALEAAHLSFDKIRQMKPEEAFNAITEAIRLIPDPILQSKVAAELFSKSALALLPGIKEGFLEVGKSAAVMRDQTVQSLEHAGDVWGDIKNRIVVYSAELVESSISVLDVLHAIGSAYDFVTRAGGAAAKVPLPPLLTARGAEEIHLTDRELANVTKTLDEQRRVLDAAAEKARQHADAIGRIRDQLTGRGAIKAALDMTEALRGALPIQALDEEAKRQINKTMGEAIEAYKRFGQVVPPAMNQAYVLTMQLPPAIRGITNVIKELGYEVEIAIPKLYDFPKPVAITSAEFELLGRNAGLTMKEMIPEAAKQSKIGIDDLSRSISQLAQISGGAFSGIAQSIGTMIGAVSTFHDSLQQVRNVDWKNGSTFQGILSTTTGILGMVSAAITAAKAIANLFDRNKGRDLVVDFAANLGGFDALHEALLQGGAAGEALWIKLTQGVGRNNPEQAKQIIAEVQRFLDELGKTVVSPTIKPHVEWPDNMPGDQPSDTDPGYASGTPGLGFVNFGARKPTWLHGDEAVVPRHKVGDLAAQIAAAMGGGGGDFDVHVYVGNEELDGRIVKVARKDAARGGTRQRATVGRSY